MHVGSTPGAKDLVDSGEIQQTAYLAPLNVPSNSTLYARMWTKIVGIWPFQLYRPRRFVF